MLSSSSEEEPPREAESSRPEEPKATTAEEPKATVGEPKATMEEPKATVEKPKATTAEEPKATTVEEPKATAAEEPKASIATGKLRGTAGAMVKSAGLRKPTTREVGVQTVETRLEEKPAQEAPATDPAETWSLVTEQAPGPPVAQQEAETTEEIDSDDEEMRALKRLRKSVRQTVASMHSHIATQVKEAAVKAMPKPRRAVAYKAMPKGKRKATDSGQAEEPQKVDKDPARDSRIPAEPAEPPKASRVELIPRVKRRSRCPPPPKAPERPPSPPAVPKPGWPKGLPYPPPVPKP